MNRGARRHPVFTNDATCALFLDHLAELPERFPVRVHGYTLMPNHFHLMIESLEPRLSDAMQYLAGRFAQRLNAVHPGWDGPVFRGRFRNQIVEDDGYWRHLLAYLHLNPVKAHLAPTVDDAHWTSHLAYVGETPAPDWLVVEELRALFGSAAAYRDYVDGVRRGRIEAPRGFEPDSFWRPPSTESRPQIARSGRRSVELALFEVGATTGLGREALLDGVDRFATIVATWWAWRSTDVSHRDLARVFGVSRARVGQRCAMVVRLAEREPRVAAWVEQLGGRIADARLVG
jgi:REP element-mobilizing transposase RayT